LNVNRSVASRIATLLAPSERRELAVLFALMLVAMALETLSIGVVLSALTLIATNDATRASSFHVLMGTLGTSSRERQIVVGMLALVVVYAAKNAFLAISTWRQARFTNQLNVNLSRRLFSLYLEQPYAFHVERNSSFLVNTIGNEVLNFTNEVVGPAILVSTELLVLIALGTLMIVVDPIGVLSVGAAAALVGWLFHALSHRKAVALGAARLYHEDRAWQHLQQGLGAVKEVIVLGRQPQFLAQYYHHIQQRGNAAQHNEVLRQVPRLALEVVAIGALAGLAIVSIALRQPTSTLVVTLGLFGAVAFRVMPSVSRILYGVQSVRYALPVVDRLYDEFSTLQPSVVRESRPLATMEHDVVLDAATYAHAAADGPVLANISLRIARGESIGIIGVSGAGKSTLIDVLLGLLEPGVGSVRIDGVDIRDDLRGWQRQIGYVPQVIYITDDSLRRNVAFGVPDEEIDDAAVRRAISLARLDAFVAALPSGLDTILGDRGIRISGGERQRVGIARALYHDPSVLVLDEATSSLDMETERGLVSTVRDLRGAKTIVIVAHRYSALEQCDRIYELRGGRVTELGAPSVLARA
jgi:ABC-type multidrug transport system fused ATPase/permease subunit